MTRYRKIISPIAFILALIFMIPSCSPSETNDTPDPITDDTTTTDLIIDDKLPEVYITTDSPKQITSKTEYSDISIRFTLNDHYAKYSNTYTDKEGGSAQLRCRGNSSYSKPDMQAKNKYSYKLRLDSKENLFGMGESRHWYLLANWFDVTHMRNKLAYDLSGTLGMTYTESTWVVLYYNGEYRGIYSLVESIRIDEGRVETFDWEDYAEDIARLYSNDTHAPKYILEALENAMKNDLSWLTTQYLSFNYIDPDTKRSQTKKIDLSGYFDPDKLDFTSGYLIEYDGRLRGDGTKWNTSHNIPVVMDNPAALSTNKRMNDYVKTLIQDFENALYSPTFYNSKGKHYSEYVDVGSMVDFWTIWNLFNNIEFGYLSMYYYIDDGKIIFGPCWDFDNATGNIVTLTEKWMHWDYWVEDRGNSSNGWFSKVVSDPYFVALCQERWFSMREAVDDMMQSLDIYYDYISEEAVRCYERNGPRINWKPHNINDGISYDFETDFNVLKNWLKNRINWIDENFSAPAINVDDCGFERSPKITVIPDGSVKIAKDKSTAFGVVADYIIPTDTNKTLSFKISTTHTSSRNVEIYLNQGKLIGREMLTSTTPATFSISPRYLRLNDGDLNVIYIIDYKANGDIRSKTSLVIKASKAGNPSSNEYCVSFGDNTTHVKNGGSAVFPKISKTRNGFIAVGWTCGDGKVYRPGERFIPTENTYFYIFWKRNNIDSHMILD